MKANPFKCINMKSAVWFRSTKRKLQKQSAVNENENQVADALRREGIRFSRNSQFARRFVDFYIHAHGACIEVDGPEHNAEYDELRDMWLFKQGTLVFRMKNGDSERLCEIIEIIKKCSDARTRRMSISKKFSNKWWMDDRTTKNIWNMYRKTLDNSRT